MVEINLNDKTNLNPNIGLFKELTKEQKTEVIEKWNQRPEVKKNGIVAICDNLKQKVFYDGKKIR